MDEWIFLESVVNCLRVLFGMKCCSGKKTCLRGRIRRVGNSLVVATIRTYTSRHLLGCALGAAMGLPGGPICRFLIKIFVLTSFKTFKLLASVLKEIISYLVICRLPGSVRGQSAREKGKVVDKVALTGGRHDVTECVRTRLGAPDLLECSVLAASCLEGVSSGEWGGSWWQHQVTIIVQL